jgi:hypothetical protein
VKPWQSKATDAVALKAAPAPISVGDQVKGISFLMKQSPSYWQKLGARAPMVAQFRVPSDDASSWYVQVDAGGGQASVGLHPSPTVTWESDAEAMEAAFCGRVLPGRVRVLGDFEDMRALFRAIAQTQIPGMG